MRIHQTPGVHAEAADASAGGVAPLRTDVAGFVGIAERGPLHVAVPVESYRQFVTWFGDAFDSGYLAYCARAFFENGGRRLWAVRVASPAASAAALVINDAAGPAWCISASSAGAYGNRLEVRVVEVRRQRLRAALDPLDPTRLNGGPWAGFARHDMVELIEGAQRARAVVQGVESSPDGASSWLRLAAPPTPALTVVSGPDQPALRVESLAYTIEVFESGRLLDVVADVSLVPEHPRYGPRLLKMPWSEGRANSPSDPPPRTPDGQSALEFFRTARNRRSAPPPALVVSELRSAAQRAALLPLDAASGVAGAAASPRLRLLGGADGLQALTVFDFIGAEPAPEARSEESLAVRRGLAVLAVNDEVALLAVPDIHIRPDPLAQYLPEPCTPDPCLPLPEPLSPAPPPLVNGDQPPLFDAAAIHAVQAAMVLQCERRRDRFALLDAPLDSCSRLSFAVPELRAWRQRFDSAYAALHAPWLKVVDPRRRGGARLTTRAIPPCGHVAGLIAATDLRLGLHHAPANVPLQWLQDTTLAFDAERHGLLNELGVNLIRAVDGRGLRVMGARTLASDPDWRFINVRRLMTMIARAIDIALQWAVFEPNDWRTRMKISLVVGNFLRSLWARGALAGALIEQAFFVRCDDSNNPASVRDVGRLVLDVGVAPVVPFEFIVLRIGRDVNGFALTESNAAALAGAV